MKFPYRGKTQSGEHVDFKPATAYEVSHAIQVWGEAGARELVDILHGRFAASYAPDQFDTLARGLYAVTLMHRGIPDKNTVRKAQEAIAEAIEEAGVKARYAGWSLIEIGPVDAPWKPWLRDESEDDADDSDSPMGMPAPLKS